MSDRVAEFRSTKVGELQSLLDACRDERLSPASEAPNILGRLRELYFFAPDMRGLVEHVIDLCNRYSIADWANNANGGLPLGEQPWSRIGDALKQLITEPALYQRDWTRGPIEPQFREAISGWPDLGWCMREVYAASPHKDAINPGELLTGVVSLFYGGCQRYFTHLQTGGAEGLENIFATIICREDGQTDMYPAALTYFGSDGLQVLNRVATEVAELRQALQNHADQGAFNGEG